VLTATIDYSTDLFDAATIERMQRHLLVLLQEIVSQPQKRIMQLALLEVDERQQLWRWNETDAQYPQDSCIHDLYEKQAARTPDAVAVVYEDERLGYRELDERANQLAHHLRGLGVGPEVVVGCVWSARCRWWWDCWGY